jgi:hypothetical protein
MHVQEKTLRTTIKKIIKSTLTEAGARSRDSARKWKQGDDLNLYSGSDEFEDEFEDDIEDDIAAELDDLENDGFDDEEEYSDDDSATVYGNQTYTLDDIVNSQVLRTRSPAGTKAWLETTMNQIHRYITDEAFAEAVMDIRDSEYFFREFQDARDSSIKFWTKVASEQLGKDVSKLPEFSDNEYMNEFLFDFWMLATFVKPIIRQLDKGKSLEEANRSVSERWKYMTKPNRIKDFIKNVITPSFEYLLRDTKAMG